MAEMSRPVTAHENGRSTTMSTIQAILRRQYFDAIKGNTRAQKAAIERYDAVQAQQQRQKLENFEYWCRYKREKTAKIEFYRKIGKEIPKMPPHPDDVMIDLPNGVPIINGPIYDVEEAKWIKAFSAKRDAIVDIFYECSLFETGQIAMNELESNTAVYHDIVLLVDSLYPSEEVRRTPGFNIHEWRKNNRKRRDIAKIFKKIERRKGKSSNI